MIHILTVHWASEHWIDIQTRAFARHIKQDYRTYTRLGNMSEGEYERNSFKFDVCLQGKVGEVSHQSDAFKLLIPIVKEAMEDGDTIMVFDSDAFPVEDIDEWALGKLKEYPFVGLEEPNHEWDQNHKIPHCAFWCFPAEYLNEGIDYPMSRKMTSAQGNWLGGVVQWLKDNDKFNYYPVQRSNVVNYHPLYFGLYEDKIYHHWAGSRDMITRPDRKLAEESGRSLEDIQDENEEMSAEIHNQLFVQVDTFIEFLKGEYKGDVE
jgi:hypothetical protein